MSEIPYDATDNELQLAVLAAQNALAAYERGDYLEACSDLHLARRSALRATERLVALNRAGGETWGAIGESVFITAQAAQQRFGRVV